MQIDNNSVTVGSGKETLDVPPTVMGGRTMLPLRFIGEKLGLTVEWNGSIQTITLTREGKEIVMKIADKTAMVDGKVVTLDTPPAIKDGRTLVPARFIAEATGAKVDWNAQTKEVTITPV